jgi:F-type H+-transporting ATPase subunit delta
MSSQAVSAYATAFYEMSKESGKANTFAEDATNLATAFKDPEILHFFKSPLYSLEDKEAVVAKALGGKVDVLLSDFINLLAKNGRLDIFPNIIEEFIDASSGGKSSKKGEVFSATELSDTEKKSLQQSIEKKLGTSVNLGFKVDSSLIGGIEARVGSYIIEDSLKSNLEKLNDSLKRSAH